MMVTEIAANTAEAMVIQIHRSRLGGHWYVTIGELLINCDGPEEALRVAISLAPTIKRLRAERDAATDSAWLDGSGDDWWSSFTFLD